MGLFDSIRATLPCGVCVAGRLLRVDSLCLIRPFPHMMISFVS
jgi:hypothetical protein